MKNSKFILLSLFALVAIVAGAIVAGDFINFLSGATGTIMATGGLPVEVWQKDIKGNLFKDNAYLVQSKDSSQYVLQGKIVHIPQAGALPGVVKNRTSFPATVTQRTDTDITYTLDQFTTEPILIPYTDLVEMSYDKRASVIMEHTAALRQHIADATLYNWSPSLSTNIIATTGVATESTLTGTTGNRKAFIVNDLKKAQNYMNKMNIPLTGRKALISADMFNQLTDNLTQTQYRDFSQYFNAETGVVGKLMGFDLYMRSTSAVYDNTTVPVAKDTTASGYTVDTDYNEAVLCWQENTVERAIGEILLRVQLNSPQYYGDIYAFEIRYGARKSRNDQKGVIAIVQAAA